MTAPPVPERLADAVREGVQALEAAGQPVTPEAVANSAQRFALGDMEAIVLWAYAVAVAEYLRERP